MHKSCIDFVIAHTSPNGKVLEVGSLDVNGNVRRFFDDYIGVDMRPGQNVDIIANGHNLPFKDESFDTVLSLNSLEHDDAFWLTAPELWRVLKPKGMLIVSVPDVGFPHHEHPQDYWRFTRDGLYSILGQGFEIIPDAIEAHMNFAIGKKTYKESEVNWYGKAWR